MACNSFFFVCVCSKSKEAASFCSSVLATPLEQFSLMPSLSEDAKGCPLVPQT